MQCKEEGCEKEAAERLGLCASHYYRHRKKILNTSMPLCSFGGCWNKARSKKLGLCDGHNMQKLQDKPLKPLMRGGYKTMYCLFPECKNKNKCRGWCWGHYEQVFKKQIEPKPLKKRNKIQGRWRYNSEGYVLRISNKKRILQHRAVMEQYIERSLLAHENIHHKNGIRDDNRIENLELWTKSQPPGCRVSDKIAWCKEFLADYGMRVESN